MADHSRLGRGLASLIGDVGEETSSADASRKPRRAAIENLRPNPRNPRRTFTDAELSELSDSIRERGIIQPIVVRPVRGVTDTFEIIAGERRLARGAARRPPRGAGRHRGSDRCAGARIRHHRERPARRLECDRGSVRLSGADGRIQPQPGRRGADRRQEPLACRQHGAAAQAVDAGESAGAIRADQRRSRAPTSSGSRTRWRSRKTSSSAA